MGNIILILILVVIIVLAVMSSIKHFRGEGGCCGGGSAVRPKKKKLKNVTHTYNFTIDGMHCQNCANAVTQAINDIDGAAAKVNLHKKEAVVNCDREIEPDDIVKAVEKKGYQAKLAEQH